MSEVPQCRKPEQKFYRHPKFGDPRSSSKKAATSSDGEKISASSEQPAAYKGDSGDRPRPPFHRHHVEQFHSFNRGFTRSIPSRRTNEYRKQQTNHRAELSESVSRGPHVSDNLESDTVAVQQTAPNAQIKADPNTDATSSVGKHGGLIHLPKDVHIYGSTAELRVGTTKSTKRDTYVTTNKPVVVVRPSFAQTSRYSESESANVSRPGNQISGTHEKHTSQMDFPSVTKLPDSSQFLWDDTTEAAFRFFLHSFNQLDPNNQKNTTTLYPSSATSTDSTLASSQGTGTMGASGAPRPPSDTVMTRVQQIVQLDGILNSLLVPPSLCAPVLSQMRISIKEDKQDRTENELLILRWWQAVQQLREHLFTLFESVILADLDFCNTAHVEQGMWKSVFYTVLELLRSWISNPDGTGLLPTKRTAEFGRGVGGGGSGAESKIVELLQSICLHDVIAKGETRLNGLLERIQSIHRVPLSSILSDGRPPPETRSRTRRLVYLSSQKLMLFLGDLARYKELLTGERNFGKARSWYQKAQLLIPKNGRSYNQLAVLAVYTSRHLDAMYYYIRTLAASNPFPTASQSLSALFNEVSPRAESLLQQIQRPKVDNPNTHDTHFGAPVGRFQRVEIWIHPVDGQTTVIQGSRRLVYLPSNQPPLNLNQKFPAKKIGKPPIESDLAAENDDEDDEEAQAELEEYANISLIELSKQFGLTFIHAHGKLFTKIGMETFPEVASLALQALSGLLAQNPCPLSAERLCQLCIVNMYNVDRAVSLTSHANQLAPSNSASDSDAISFKLQPISRLTGVETLRSVHHDHAARFALDTFSLLCRRAAQLLQQAAPSNAPSWWLPPDVRLILPALRLWSEWMILHPEHWLPPPNHRDPTLRPCLNDWQLVAEMCTRASNWLTQCPRRPRYEELTPTTSLIMQLKEGEAEQRSADSGGLESSVDAAFLFEESLCAGFKPMLDLVPKMYRYTGNWPAETVSDFVRVDKLVLLGDFLCGIDSPVLQYDVDRATYESAVERESSERRQDRPAPTSTDSRLKGRSSSESETTCDRVIPSVNEPLTSDELVDAETSSDILALQRQRALLQRQLEEEQRLIAWRRNAIRQAASGGRRGVELEVRPIYLLPDTNCYIDWLEGIATLAQRSSNYTVLVPIVVVNELDTLARSGGRLLGSSRSEPIYEDEGGEVTRAGLIQERARTAIAYLENEFAQRNSRLRALTAKGSFLETIAYRTEVNGGRDPGQVNDDVILTCCTHFCKEDPDRFRSTHGLDQTLTSDGNNQPIRIVREIVLLTSDRNLRLKALNINLPARPLRTFVNWSRLPVITQLPQLSTDSVLTRIERKSEFPKLQPHGQWKQPLKH